MSIQERPTSTNGHNPDASKEWANVEDSEERRRIQNRLAQRKYRMLIYILYQKLKSPTQSSMCTLLRKRQLPGARVKKLSYPGKARDYNLTMTMPDANHPLEGHGQDSFYSSSSMLDHDISPNALSLLDPGPSQSVLDSENFSSPYNPNHHHMLREQDLVFPISPRSCEVKSSRCKLS